MKQVTPYQNLTQALGTLDNGGRFYNFFSKAGDGKVDPAELSRVAGVIGDRQRMFLFYELALLNLAPADRQSLEQSLSSELSQLYALNKPAFYTPQQAINKGSAGEAAIIEGVPVKVDEECRFTAFIMVPIMAGKVMTFSMIPIFEKFQIYQLTDPSTEQEFIIAHAKSDRPLPEEHFTFAGVLKELQGEKQADGDKRLFLEAFYYA
ncbi:MAG: hypothetical protein HWE13_02720 [Gammaproteobacteria bacterium]|nr:hypothetical protein [Gammaproteobacteria bacterium]NVK87008.1 hypothetical protein [Gammaproteobacteria bacterium]